MIGGRIFGFPCPHRPAPGSPRPVRRPWRPPLLGKHTSPTQAAVRAERLIRLQEAINALDPIDREILSLRHFEELSRSETAQALGIEEAAAAKRYVRALKRLKDLLGDE